MSHFQYIIRTWSELAWPKYTLYAEKFNSMFLYFRASKSELRNSNVIIHILGPFDLENKELVLLGF